MAPPLPFPSPSNLTNTAKKILVQLTGVLVQMSSMWVAVSRSSLRKAFVSLKHGV
jgi:hypothetical protein